MGSFINELRLRNQQGGKKEMNTCDTSETTDLVIEMNNAKEKGVKYTKASVV